MSGNPPQEEDKKPAEQSAHINLKVKGQLQDSFTLRVDPTLGQRTPTFGVDSLREHAPSSIGNTIGFNPTRGLHCRTSSCLEWEMIDPLLDGNEVFFRIKRSTQLRKLMNAYCDRQSVDFNSIAFLFDGRRLRGEQTPDELEMEDGDEIDAMLHQTGGGSNVA